MTNSMLSLIHIYLVAFAAVAAAAVATLLAGLIDAARDLLADALGGFDGQQRCV